MAHVGWALQKALYAELDGALSVPVYNPPPPDAQYPYATIGDEDSDDASGLTDIRTDRVIFLHVWSAQRSKDEVYQVLGEMRDALNRKRLTLDTGRLIDLQVRGEQITTDIDGKTFTGRMTLRARTQP